MYACFIRLKKCANIIIVHVDKKFGKNKPQNQFITGFAIFKIQKEVTVLQKFIKYNTINHEEIKFQSKFMVGLKVKSM